MTILDGLLLVILQNHAHGIFRLRHADDIFTGLGIRLSVFQFFARFANFLWAKEGFPREKEQIALLSWATLATGAKRSTCSLKKSKWAKSAGIHSLLDIKRGKLSKNLSSNLLVFCDPFARITSESLTTLFLQEQIAHSCSPTLHIYVDGSMHVTLLNLLMRFIYIRTSMRLILLSLLMKFFYTSMTFLDGSMLVTLLNHAGDISGWIHAIDIYKPCG